MQPKKDATEDKGEGFRGDQERMIRVPTTPKVVEKKAIGSEGGSRAPQLKRGKDLTETTADGEKKESTNRKALSATRRRKTGKLLRLPSGGQFM